MTTPGPWVVDDLFAFGSSAIVADRGRANHVVAEVRSGSRLPNGFAEGNANARLIAAAPDLLAAAEAILHWYEVDSSEFNRETAIAAVRAAIEKARGQ